MNPMRDRVLSCARPLHAFLRGRKARLFCDVITGSRTDSLLDVGGAPGIAGEFLAVYRRFRRIVSANLNVPDRAAGGDLDLRHLIADGCRLPFANGAFDWVFSNAVIEHVGGWERQRLFASEVRRVASAGYFVTTPNRFFPIEQHTFLPCYQFLPVSAQKRVASYSPGYLKAWEEINLLSRGQMRELFPEAQVRGSGTPLIPNSLIAFHKRSVR